MIICIAVLPVLLLMLVAALSMRGERANAAPLAPADAPAPTVASPQDRSFIDQFLRAGFAAIEAGELAATRAGHAEVRRFGATLATAFRGATRELQAIAAGLDLPPLATEPDAEHKAAGDRLRALPPAAFDATYLAQVTRDLEDLARVADIEADTGDSPGLTAFATAHRGNLRALLDQAHALTDQITSGNTVRAVPPPASPPVLTP